MLTAFAESVRSLVQPCSLVVVVPPVCAVLAARGRRTAVVGAVVGGVVGGWIYAGRWLVLDPWEVRASAVLVLAAISVLAVAGLQRTPTALQTRTALGVAAASVSFVAVLWWRPCVGSELGRILSGFPDEPIRFAPLTAAYMTGLMVPAIVAGLLLDLGSRRPAVARWASGAGAAIVAILGMAVLAGRHGELVSELVRLTEG